jgi:hypothetical protein
LVLAWRFPKIAGSRPAFLVDDIANAQNLADTLLLNELTLLLQSRYADPMASPNLRQAVILANNPRNPGYKSAYLPR